MTHIFTTVITLSPCGDVGVTSASVCHEQQHQQQQQQHAMKHDTTSQRAVVVLSRTGVTSPAPPAAQVQSSVHQSRDVTVTSVVKNFLAPLCCSGSGSSGPVRSGPVRSLTPPPGQLKQPIREQEGLTRLDPVRFGPYLYSNAGSPHQHEDGCLDWFHSLTAPQRLGSVRFGSVRLSGPAAADWGPIGSGTGSPHRSR